MESFEENRDGGLSAVVERAVAASRALLSLSGHERREILSSVADALEADREAVLAANGRDMDRAREDGLPDPVLARMLLDESRFLEMIRSLRTLADFEDPLGKRVSRWVRPNGLEIERVRVPLGVVGVCCESRPKVLPIVAASCLKVSDALVFVADAGVRETHGAVLAAIRRGGEAAGMPADAVQVVCGPDHVETCRELLSYEGKVDVAILRGSQSFVSDLSQCASVPVLRRLGSLCHVYVDCDHPNPDLPRETFSTDLAMAADVAINSCLFDPQDACAASVLLVHSAIADRFLPLLGRQAAAEGLRLRADERARKFLAAAEPVGPKDFTRLSPDGSLSVGMVDSLEEAACRINANGSRLVDTIVSGSPDAQREFQRAVDSAVVCVNASTNFAGGASFGMGADVGFSSDKLDPRGPIGLEGLTSLKYLVLGDGQIREA